MPDDGSLVTPDQAVRDRLRKMSELSTATLADEVPGSARLTRPLFPPVLSSAEFLKRREAPGWQVQALAYEDTAGSPWFWIVRLIEDDSGSGVCVAGAAEAAARKATLNVPIPRINYAGCWGGHGLALGGRVTGTGAEQATSARLSIRDAVLIDEVEGES